MTVRDQLSRDLRRAFPRLTVERTESIWQWVLKMERGKVMLLEADRFHPEDIVVALHLARELAFFNTAELHKIIKGLSAAKKRRNYPRSYGA